MICITDYNLYNIIFGVKCSDTNYLILVISCLLIYFLCSTVRDITYRYLGDTYIKITYNIFSHFDYSSLATLLILSIFGIPFCWTSSKFHPSLIKTKNYEKILALIGIINKLFLASFISLIYTYTSLYFLKIPMIISLITVISNLCFPIRTFDIYYIITT